MNSKLSEPIYYILSLNTSEVLYDIRVNDVTLYRNLEIGSTLVDFKVNQYVFTGENTISIHVYHKEEDAGFEPVANCEIILYKSADPKGEGDKEFITQLKFTAKDQVIATGFESTRGFNLNQPKIKSISNNGNIGVQAIRSFNLETPFSRWLWLDSVTLPSDDATKQTLIKLYQNFYDTLKTKDIAVINQMLAQRINEMQEAYNLDLDTAKKYIQWQELMKDPNIYLDEINFEDAQLEVYGNGKLAKLVDIDYDGIIVYSEKDDSSAHYLNLIFCKTNDQRWIPIR